MSILLSCGGGSFKNGASEPKGKGKTFQLAGDLPALEEYGRIKQIMVFTHLRKSGGTFHAANDKQAAILIARSHFN